MDQLGQPFDQLPAGVSLEWTSLDAGIATVDGTGLVTGRQAGATSVGAKASGRFGNVSVSAPVTVRPQVTSLDIAAGDGQTGTVGEALPQRLAARVSNRVGVAVPGVVVDFAVVQGGGSLSSASATTNAQGVAEVEWTVGNTSGPNAVEAHTARLPVALIRFTATATAGPVSSLTVVSGNAQTGAASAALAQPLVARVADRYGNPVAAVSVDWAVTSGGGSVTPTTSASDASGQASTQWTLGPVDGAQNATGSVAGALLVGYSANAVAPVASVVVSPPTASVGEGGAVAFTATPQDPSGTPLTGRTVVWSTSDAAVATIDQNGLLTAVGPGSVTVRATVNGVEGTATVTVTPAPVASVTVAPASVSLTVGGSLTFTATAMDANGRVLSGRPVSWSVSDLAIASIGPSGLLSALAVGSVNVTATVEGIQGSASVTITSLPAPVASVAVTPANPTVVSGTTQQLTAVAKDAAGNVLSGRTVTWSSVAGTIASVDANGLVTAALVGAATITATVEGVDGTTTVTVTPGAASTGTSVVSVTPGSVAVNETATLTLTTNDAAGNPRTTGGLIVGFTATGGTSSGNIGATTDHNDGTYTATFSGLTAGTPLTIGATIGGVAVSSTLPTLQVTPGTMIPVMHWTNASGGDWTDAGNWDQNRVPTAQDTAYLDLAGTYTVDVTSNVAVGGVYVGPTIASGVTLQLSDQVLTVGGVFAVRAGGTLRLNVATVEAARVTVQGPLAVTPGGASRIDGSLTVGLGGAFTLSDNATLDVTGDLDNVGAITLTSTATGASPILHVTGQIVNAATITATVGSGGARTISAASIINRGSINATLDPTSFLLMQASGPSGLQNDVGASITLASSSMMRVLGVFTNAGRLEGSGAFDVSSATFVNDGTIAPGIAGPGLLTFVGPVTLASQSVIDLELGGPDPVDDYDALVATVTPTLGGTLNVTTVNGFEPAADQIFALIVYPAAATGTFATITLPTLGTGLDWDEQYSPAGFAITVQGAGAGLTIAEFAGNGQTAAAGALVPVAPAVQVTDAQGNAVQNLAVHFDVTVGGGSVTAADQLTNADGVATVGSWRLGGTPGPNGLTATAAGSGITGNPVSFGAIGLGANPAPVTLALGQQYSCRINVGQSQCWGTNGLGQLGDGTNTPRTLPVAVFGGHAFVAITAGTTHACALEATGQAWCWGDNTYGQFGNGGTAGSTVPVPAGVGLIFNQITAGAAYTCGIVPGGQAYCWGSNGRGNLGDGTTSPELLPTPVAGGLTFTTIVAGGDNHTCALNVDGQAYCWGYNFDGELGDGTFSDRLIPTPVTGGIKFSQIQANIFHTCALTPAGSAFCWGDNNVRQLGDGNTADQPSPQPVVGGHTFTFLGYGATCALEANGSAWCWGFNPNGEVGDGTTNIALAPTLVQGDHSFDVIASSGWGHTCARTPAGNTWCWGLGVSGQLGDGTNNSHLTPIEVGVLPPSQLGFTAQPSSVLAGATMTPAVRVAIQDVSGGTITTATGPVTIALGSNPGGAALSGTLTVPAVNGVATFSDLSLNQPAVGYTFVATAAGLTTATSNAFTVTAPLLTLDIVGSDVVGVGSSIDFTINLSLPAPVGGVTVTVTSDAPGIVSVATPGTAFIAAGTSTGQVTINGVALGGTTLRATAPGYADAALAVQATNQIISIPTTLNVPYGQTVSIPVQLAAPAPPGGVTVSLVSSDPSRVAVVTPTVVFAAGAQLGSGIVAGVLPGPATVTATAPAWATDVGTVTTTANLNIVAITSGLNATFGQSMSAELRSGGGPVSAPAPGVTVTLTPANPACATTTSPLTIPTGQVSVGFTVVYGGSASLPCTTTITATASNITSATVTVTVQPAPGLSLQTGSRIGRGLQAVFSGGLGASNYGTTTVHLTSSNPSVALLSRNDSTPGSASIDIPMTAPATSYNFYVQGLEGIPVNSGFTITASATGFNGTSVAATIVQEAIGLAGPGTSTTTLNQPSPFAVRVGALGVSSGMTEQAVRAGGVAIVPTVSVSDGAVGQIGTQDSTRPAVTTVILPRQARSSTLQTQRGVQFVPLAAGTTRVRPTLAGFTTVDSSTVTVGAPSISVTPSVRVGRGLQTLVSFGLSGATNYDTATVRITSANPGIVLVARTDNVVGAEFIDVPLVEPATSFNVTVQALEGTAATPDSIKLIATAQRFTPDTMIVVVARSAVGIVGPAATTTTLSQNSGFVVRIGVINTTNNGIQAEQPLRAGADTVFPTAFVTDSFVGRIATKDSVRPAVTTFIAARQSRSPTGLPARGVEFVPRNAGTTRVKTSIPGYVPVDSTTVNVTAPVLFTGSTRVGRGLQGQVSGSVSASNYDTATVHIVSLNPAIALVAPIATTPGAASIDIHITEPTTSFQYWIQGVEGSALGPDSIKIIVSADRFTPDTGYGVVARSAVGLVGPAGNLTTLSPNGDFQVRIGVTTSATNNAIAIEQPIRAGGVPLDAVVTHSNPVAAQLVTRDSSRQTVSVHFNVGTTRSLSFANGGVQIEPLSTGVTRVKPSIAGFAIADSTTVTISTPALSLSGAGTRVGRGLQIQATGSLGGSDYGTVTVHLTSSDSTKVLLAPNATTVGHGAIDIALTAPTTTFNYWVQGVEGAAVPATVTITASAPGFTDGTTTFTLVQSAVGVLGLPANLAQGAANRDFQIRIGAVNVAGNGIQGEQPIRAGGTPVTFSVTSSNATAARLVTNVATGQTVNVTIGVGGGVTRSPTFANGGVQFDPLAVGSVTVSAAHADFVSVEPQTVNVTATAAATSVDATGGATPSRSRAGPTAPR